MQYLVDGHNLIGTGRLPGISLADEDDEIKLIRLLRRYQSRVRVPITVVFDRGLPGGVAPHLSGGGVTVIFAGMSGQTADEVIRARVRKSRHPEALRVVTDDVAVQRVARERGCQVIPAHVFARELTRPLPQRPAREDVHLSPEEVEEWLALFRRGKKDK